MTSQGLGSSSGPDDEVAVWRGLLRVHAHVVAQQNADLEHRLGLSVTEWEVLYALASAPDGRRRIGDIAGIVLLTSGGVTRLVSRLEQRALVERVACSDDRRGTSVALTPAGRDAFHAARPVDVLRELFLDRLSDEQRAQLRAAWETVLPGSTTVDDATWAARRRAR